MEPPGAVVVAVDCAKVVHTMRGGMGASWHAMETEIPYGVRHPHFSSYSHGGSGWGAYPCPDGFPRCEVRHPQKACEHAFALTITGLDIAPAEPTIPLT